MAPPGAAAGAEEALATEFNRVLGKAGANLARSCRELDKRLSTGPQPPPGLLCRTAARLHLKECAVLAVPNAKRAAAEVALAAAEAGLAGAPRCALLHLLRVRALQQRAQALSSAAEAAASAASSAAQQAAAAAPASAASAQSAAATAAATAEAASSATREAWAVLKDACSDALRTPPVLMPPALLEEEKRESVEAGQRSATVHFPMGELHFWCAARGRSRARGCGGARRRREGCARRVAALFVWLLCVRVSSRGR
jgi:hypothetical protein